MSKAISKGVIAAGHKLTAEAGAEMLRAGGTAMDAGIAALAMACVCEPVLASPGGVGFAMLADGNGTRLIDFFAQTPRVRRQPGNKGAREIIADFGTATQAFHIGPATAATPGFFKGIEEIPASGAKLPLSDLFAPAIRAARDGVLVTPYQNYLSTVVVPILSATPAAADLFTPGGAPVAAGGIFRNPGLAAAFEILSKGEAGTRQLEAAIVAMQEKSGNLTDADFSRYAAVTREPLAVRLGGATVYLNPLPAASGPLITHSLGGLGGSWSVAAAARALARTDQARRDAKGDLASLVPSHLRQRGTTHISVMDADGRCCSITTSNGEGNGELVGGYGFMLNNILGEEDVNPALTGDWPLDTRLSSMMCPAIVRFDDGATTVLGSGGSNRIRSAIFHVLARHVASGEALESAVTAGRMHIEGGHLDFEDLFDEAEKARLQSEFSDHRCWPERNMFFGGVHAVHQEAGGAMSGIGDPRREGAALLVD